MNPKTATGAIQKLISVDKVPVILGAFGSSITLAVAPIAERNKVVLFSASSTADSIKDAGDYIFRNVPTNKAQGKTAAQFARKDLGAKNACILYMNNDYGLTLADSFKEAFNQAGGVILSIEAYAPGTSDFRTQLTKIRRMKPQVIFFPGHYQESGLILKQAKELGVVATFIGGDGSYAPDLFKIAGSAADGSFYTLMAMSADQDNVLVRDFLLAFKRKYGQEPDVYSAYAYDAVGVLAEAIKSGGYTADGIKRALYELPGYHGITGLTKFDSFGEVDKPFAVYKAENGKFQRVS